MSWDLAAERIREIDARHIWHPYSDLSGSATFPVVRSASGVRLTLERMGAPADVPGEPVVVIDGMSSWWAAIHGYRHPTLDAAMTDQAGRMSHVMFGGLTHEPAARLAELLVRITPEPLETVFFSDSGSVSIEVAVKMALQYWRSRGKPAKHRLLTWRGGYHGDTFTPMSVCDPEGGMHSEWSDVLARQIFSEEPPTGYDPRFVERFEALVAQHADEVAAVIVEPVVQGAGGMRFHDPRTAGELRGICDRHGVLLIFDEIATGFGRTGTLFAADAAGVAPDIMCVGKALTGGYMSMAATLCTAEVAQTIANGPIGVLAHGPTFMANPLACAIAVASTELLLESPWQQRVSGIESQLRSGLAPAAEVPGVADVRVQGAIGVVQLDHPVDVDAATDAALAAGVWLRPFRDLIYAMPPYICEAEDISAISEAIVAAARVA